MMDSLTPVGDPVTRIGERESFGEVYQRLGRIERKLDRAKLVQWIIGALIPLAAVARPAFDLVFGSDTETRLAQAREAARQEVVRFEPQVTAVRLEVIEVRHKHEVDVESVRQEVRSGPMRVARRALPR